MATSGTYDFATPQNDELINEGYERVGIVPSLITPQKVDAAQRSINYALQSWVNRGLNLWTVKQGMLALKNNQQSYVLPNNAIDILEATIRTSTRNLGGTASTSAGGTAQSAFDANDATACTQTSADGNISYTWGAATFGISMVGIQSNTTTTYTLECEYSTDGATWVTAVSIPVQTYTDSTISWFAVPAAVPAAYFRIRETDGATLDIQELYFNTNVDDTIMNPVSRSEYIAFPNKSQTGRPSSFYVDRQISPVVYIWPTPNTIYNNMFYTFTQSLQDAGGLIDTAQVPARFLEALASELAYRLGIKEGLPIDKISILKQIADSQYEVAGSEDRARVPLRIYGDSMGGWTSV
jgi:hypothetical protein